MAAPASPDAFSYIVDSRAATTVISCDFRIDHETILDEEKDQVDLKAINSVQASLQPCPRINDGPGRAELET